MLVPVHARPEGRGGGRPRCGRPGRGGGGTCPRHRPRRRRHHRRAARRLHGRRRCSAPARSRRSQRGSQRRRSVWSSSTIRLSPVQQRNLEKAWKAKVIDRTGLILEIFGERAQTREGRAAGRTRPSHLPEEPPRPKLDPPRTAARRLRLPRRSRRDADRGRPAGDLRPDRQDQEGTPDGRHAPAAAAPEPQAVRPGGRRAGRLHQRRQVDAVQRADPVRGVRRQPAVRHARSDAAPGRAAERHRASSSRTRSASSPTCRPRSSRHSARRWRRWPRPT